MTVRERDRKRGRALPLAHAKCHKNKLPANMTNSNNSDVNFAKTTRNFRDSQLQHLKRVESAALTQTEGGERERNRNREIERGTGTHPAYPDCLPNEFCASLFNACSLQIYVHNGSVRVRAVCPCSV